MDIYTHALIQSVPDLALKLLIVDPIMTVKPTGEGKASAWTAIDSHGTDRR